VGVVTVHEAKTHLSRLLVAAELGEDVVIARSGNPVARIVPLSDQSGGRRRLGRLRGQATIGDPPLGADQIRQLFEGE
jgi:prevent-host-death family protein